MTHYHHTHICPCISSITTEQEANEILCHMNPNIRKKNRNWTEGLTEDTKRFVPYNGQLSEAQMSWLRAVLAKSSQNGERILVVCVCLFVLLTVPLYHYYCYPTNGDHQTLIITVLPRANLYVSRVIFRRSFYTITV